MDEYWKRYANNFPKLAQMSSVLRLWPSTSTSLERGFSQISARYNKRGNRIICETLSNLHNSGRQSREFIAALKKTCQDLGISYEQKDLVLSRTLSHCRSVESSQSAILIVERKISPLFRLFLVNFSCFPLPLNFIRSAIFILQRRISPILCRFFRLQHTMPYQIPLLSILIDNQLFTVDTNKK